MPLRYATRATESYDYQLTIGHLLDRVRMSSRSNPIVYRDRTVYDYAGLIDRVGRLASILRDAGVQPGMTVSVMDWDSHRYLESYFAVPMMGAVLHTVNVRLSVAQIGYTLRDAAAHVLLVHRDFFPLAEQLLPSLPGVKAVIAILDGADTPLPDFANGEYEALSDAADPDYPFEDFDENAVATTFYTSGTTGDPKGVCFTHRQIVLHTLAVMAPFGAGDGHPTLGNGDVYMPLTPMFHVHAWGIPYVATMLGLKQVYPGRYEPDMICRLRQDHGVTFSHCVPTILQMILALAEAGKADVAGWRIVVGGSALPRQIFLDARRQGMALTAGYGMSETGPFIAMAPPCPAGHGLDEESLANAMTAAGRVGPLVSARIATDAMEWLPHDGRSVGELVLRAPWLTPGYNGGADAAGQLWHGGWLHTQDLASIDEDGTIRIRDRIKDVIKTGGEWIDSLQVENLLLTIDSVAEVAVIAVADAKWGERPLALIVAKADQSVTLDMLNEPIMAAVNQGAVNRYALLDRFELVDQLPRTSVGKIDKRKLRQDRADGA